MSFWNNFSLWFFIQTHLLACFLGYKIQTLKMTNWIFPKDTEFKTFMSSLNILFVSFLPKVGVNLKACQNITGCMKAETLILKVEKFTVTQHNKLLHSWCLHIDLMDHILRGLRKTGTWPNSGFWDCWHSNWHLREVPIISLLSLGGFMGQVKCLM